MQVTFLPLLTVGCPTHQDTSKNWKPLLYEYWLSPLTSTAEYTSLWFSKIIWKITMFMRMFSTNAGRMQFILHHPKPIFSLFLWVFCSFWNWEELWQFHSTPLLKKMYKYLAYFSLATRLPRGLNTQLILQGLPLPRSPNIINVQGACFVYFKYILSPIVVRWESKREKPRAQTYLFQSLGKVNIYFFS